MADITCTLRFGPRVISRAFRLWLGSSVDVTVEFRDSAGAGVSVSGVAISATKPSGVVVTWTQADLTEASAGVFVLNAQADDLDELGDYVFVGSCSSPQDETGQGALTVLPVGDTTATTGSGSEAAALATLSAAVARATAKTLWLTPEEYGARGDGDPANFTGTDDSAAIADMLTDAMARKLPIRLGPKTYRLSATRLPPINGPIIIRGEFGLTRLWADPAYCGPVLLLDDMRGLYTGQEGGSLFQDFCVIAQRSDAQGNLIPIGQQHGIVFTGLCDVSPMVNVWVEKFRGFGINTARDYTFSSNRALREQAWVGVRVRYCGAGPAFPALAMPGAAWDLETTNNVYFLGCTISGGFGPLLRMDCREGSRRMGRAHFKGLMVHNAVDGEAGTEADIDFTQFACLEINGAVDVADFDGIDFNAAKDGQWTVDISNDYQKRIPIAADAISTTAGSGTITIRLPALPTYTMQQGDLTTRNGSPQLFLNWPGHTCQVGDFITFDRYTAGSRVVASLNCNGVRPNFDLRIVAISGDTLTIQATRGFATVTGPVDIAGLAANVRTVSRAYNLEETDTRVSLDEFVGGLRVTSSLSLGGIALTGVFPITTMSDFWTFTITAKNNAVATSTATSNTAELGVWLAADSILPTSINLDGKMVSGRKGIRVRAGGAISIKCQSPAPDIDLQVTDGIRGTVNYYAEGRESRYLLDIDPDIAYLVNSYAATESQLPIRSAALAIGARRDDFEFSYIQSGATSGATARRLTDDGNLTIDGPNTFQLQRPGVYLYDVAVSALQTGGTAGIVGDYACWQIPAVLTYGGLGDAVLQSVSGSSSNVGVALAPNAGSSTGAATWRVTLSADTDWNTLAVSGAGDASKTVSWTARVRRLQNMTDSTWRGDVVPLLQAMAVTPDSTRQALITSLVDTLVSAGIWDKISLLYVLAAHTSQASLLNWKDPTGTPAISAGSITFTTDRGWSGDAATGYLDTQKPSNAVAGMSVNNIHVGGYAHFGGSNSLAVVGQTTGSGISLGSSAGSLQTRLGGTATATADTVPLNVGTHLMASRSDSAGYARYVDGVAASSAVQASATLNTNNLTICRVNTSYAPATMSARAAHWGAALTASEVATLRSALQTYMAAIGAS